LLDIWQLNNVEFKQGIVLREALRTMRNSPASYKQAVPFRETYGIVDGRATKLNTIDCLKRRQLLEYGCSEPLW
jgi:hypothetical protein